MMQASHRARLLVDYACVPHLDLSSQHLGSDPLQTLYIAAVMVGVRDLYIYICGVQHVEFRCWPGYRSYDSHPAT